MLNLKTNIIKNRFWFLLFLTFFCVFMWAKNAQADSQTFNIILPQRVDGVAKLEYFIDGQAQGSVDGKTSVNLPTGTNLYFLFQIESTGYSHLLAKDIKIVSDQGASLGLRVYEYDKNQNIVVRDVADDELIDPQQTYVSDIRVVNKNENFSIQGIKLDTFSANIKLDNIPDATNEALNVTYQIQNNNVTSANFNESDNSYNIKDIPVNSSFKLWINTTSAYSQSNISFLCNEDPITSNSSDQSLLISEVTSDMNIKVQNIQRNQYSLSFTSYSGTTFNYKKDGSGAGFAPVPNGSIFVTDGDSYFLTCQANDGNALNDKEITANGTAIIPINSIYSLLDISENTTVAITGKNDSSYQIILPASSVGVTVTDASGTTLQKAAAKSGSNFEFKISPSAEYTQNIGYALIYAVPTSKLVNGDYNTQANAAEAAGYLLTPSTLGVYTISSITQPMAIVVKNLDVNTYKVNLPLKINGASYTVATSDNVKKLSENKYSVVYGQSMAITMIADTGKSVSNLNLVSDNNPNFKFSQNGNVYNIENITQNTDIIISGVTDASYDVTFSGTGILCKDKNGNIYSGGKTSVTYGTGIVEFTVEPDTGYEISPDGISVSLTSESNATLTLPSDGNEYYTLSNVTKNEVVNITGIIPKTMTVSLYSSNDSIEFVSTNTSEILPQSNSVSYGSDFEFAVASTSGENVSNITPQTSDESELTSLGDNVYSLKSVSRNTAITAFNSTGPTSNPAADSTPKYWRIARHVNLVSNPPGACTLNFTNYSSGTTVAPDKNAFLPQAYSLSSNLSYNFTRTDVSSYAFSKYKFYYDSNLQHEISSSLYPISGDYHIAFQNEITGSATTENSLGMWFSLNNDGDQTLNNYNYGIYGGGIDSDKNGDILNVFDTIYVVATFNTSLPQENTTINFLPPPAGAEYYSVETMEATSSDSTYVQEGDILNNPSYNLSRSSGSGEFLFIVRLNEGYEMDNGAVKVRPDDKITLKQIENVWPTENKYCYSLSNSYTPDVQVYIESGSVRKKPCLVNFSGDGTNFTDENGNQFLTQNLDYGSSFNFFTQAKDGYTNDGLTFNLIINGDEQALEIPTAQNPTTTLTTSMATVTASYNSEAQNIQYTLSNIKGGFTVKVDRQRQKFNISFEIPDGITYYITAPDGTQEKIDNTNSVQQVEYERNFSFTVEANEGYDITSIVISANHQILDFINGKYTIRGITESITVRAEGITSITNTVTFTQSEGITFKDTNGAVLSAENQVNYGDYLEFKTVLSSAYSSSAITVSAEYASGRTEDFKSTNDPSIAPYVDTSTGIYKIMIKENTRIYVNGLALNQYSIKLAKTTGIIYYNQYGTAVLSSPAGSENNDFIIQNVTYGKNFSFKVMAAEGYDISNLNVYKKAASIGSTQIKMFPANEVYTIENVTDSYTVAVENVAKTTCQVTFNLVDGVKCIDDYGNNLPSTVTVEYGDNYTFKLSLDEAYNKSSPTVTIKGTSNNIAPNADGSYTIPTVKSNMIIEIINVTKNSYTATFEAAEGVVYKNSKNKPFIESLDVEYGSTLYFKVSLLDAYDKSTPWVLLNGSQTLVENGGVYSLENIRQDVKISVKNVVKNPEEIAMEDINNVPDNITSDSDVDAVVKATLAYLSLSDEIKAEVLSIAKLETAQQQASKLTHASGGINIGGVDWNIKLTVTNLSSDDAQMADFAKNVDRKSVLSLYQMTLINLFTGQSYDVPYGQKVTVTMPTPDLTGYENAVVAHQLSTGSMEYLDANITTGTAKFQTSSFSLFGIAAKQIPNYAKNPSSLTISVAGLVDNEEELQTLLGEGLVSQLGDLTAENPSQSSGSSTSDTTGSTSSTNTDASGSSAESIIDKIGINKVYTWAMNNELLSVILIIIIGSVLIAIIFIISKKKNKES